jgi:hypothetical protein
MLDIPETLSILLAILLIVLGTRHWLSVNGLHREDRSNKSDQG